VRLFSACSALAGSDLAAQVFKDPHLFDVLGTADPRRKREVANNIAAGDALDVEWSMVIEP